ncbi:MAG: hypothetical protein HYW86_03895 [Candidatus Roizmanbacteria bacterium]|nr:MAG: hypothetical protein HYW86_03895 [Candidatus Roizmanbacteria bacterium]
MNFYSDYFQHTPQDDFGYSPEWNQEINKWLEFVFYLNKDYYKKNKKRVLIDKQRNELLGELKTIYFFGKILRLNIEDLEPDGKDYTKLDLSIKDLKNNLWKVEVKAPSWKGQLWKDSNLSESQKRIRVSKPKYINGEAGSFSSEEEIKYTVEDSIKNALPKFTKGDNNLLVITPDMHHQIITMLAVSAMAGGSGAIQDEITTQDGTNIISTVLILEPILPALENEVRYSHKFIGVNNKPILPTIAEFI